MEEKKLACIGSFEIFKALDMDIYSAENAGEAQEILKKIRRDYNLIVISEKFAENMNLEEFREERETLIIEMPDEKGSTGAGRRKIAELISKASGLEIKKGEP